MGAFNRYLVEEACPSCGKTIERAFQFKFGNKQQYDYRRDDILGWGGNDEGKPDLPVVYVDCTPEGCPHCGFDYDTNMITGFRLRLEHDRIKGHEGPLSYSRLDYVSTSDLRGTEERLESVAEQLGLMLDWTRNEELSAETDTTYGEHVWIHTTQSANATWTGPIEVSVSLTTRADDLEAILRALGFELLRRYDSPWWE